MSGTLVPAGTHQNVKILGTAGYRVPRKFQKLGTVGSWVPAKFSTMPTPGFMRTNKQFGTPDFHEITVLKFQIMFDPLIRSFFHCFDIQFIF